jgi:muramoyltetrapeptide carboxypeptidase
VVAPGFAVRPERLDAGLARIESLGFVPVLGRHARDLHGYFAGTDGERADDFNRFLRDPGVRAVWFARGGYGAARILDAIDWRAARSVPRWLIGYSDNTAIFLAGMARRAPWRCLHGPVVGELADRGAFHRPSLLDALAGRPAAFSLRPRQVLVPGRARGPLVGGNLTVLVHLLGTRDLPPLDGAVLFLEDVGEEAYRIDRALDHLVRSRRLDGIAAVVVGSVIAPATARGFPPDRRVRDVLADLLAPLGVPVVWGIPVGHLRGKRTVAMGEEARLDTGRGTLVVGGRGRAR